MSNAYKLGIGVGVLLGMAAYWVIVWLLPIMGKWTWIIT